MDGTSNNPTIPTNIYRTYQEIEAHNDGKTIGIYLYGVGNIDHPTAGKAIAIGMEMRIARAYAYIIENYTAGDKIYIFGFSRGALSARALAGIISYAGIPQIAESERKGEITQKISHQIIELVKDERDVDYRNAWGRWRQNDKPLLAELIKEQKILGRQGWESQAAEIEFLGVWDTVPGSLILMNEYFGNTDISCKERLDWNKKWPFKFFLVGGLAKGERYKIDTYPAIHFIAHAVSRDEKRSMFRPLFICSKSINPETSFNDRFTTVNERVFPGAHADVGGGYEDFNNELPEISLNWMLSLLREHYKFVGQPKTVLSGANPIGLAHLSISDSIASKGSKCRNRSEWPNDIKEDPSIATRESAGELPLAIFSEKAASENPTRSCLHGFYSKELEVEKIKCVTQNNINCGYIAEHNWIHTELDKDDAR